MCLNAKHISTLNRRWATDQVKGRPIKKALAYAQAERLRRGVNFGNALDAPSEGDWGMVIQEEYFQQIKEAGFDTIGVPIRWSAHALEEPPYTIEKTFFERVDWVINNGLAQGLNIVINIHHYNEIFEYPDAHTDRFVEMWKQIITRYKDLPDNVYFELLNEPHGNLNAEKWNMILAATISSIRQNDNRHTLILAGIWGRISSLSTLNIPKEETNFIVTIHFYEPLLFTHQGAGWVPKEYGTIGVIWPGPPETKLHPIPHARSVDWVKQWFIRYNQESPDINPAGPKPIMEALDDAVAWSEKYNVPLWLGEFGAYKKADMQSRVNWTKFVREQAEVRNIPWAYWEFGAEFGVYDRKAQDWNKGLLEALIPSERKDHLTIFHPSESLIYQSEDLYHKSQIDFVK